MANPYCAGSRDKTTSVDATRFACLGLFVALGGIVRHRRLIEIDSGTRGGGEGGRGILSRREARFTGIRSEFNEWSHEGCYGRLPGTRNPNVRKTRARKMTTVGALTCDCESGVPARDGSRFIPRDAPIYTAILLLLAVHHPQKEQGSRWQQDPMRLGVARRRLHELAVLVPLYHRFGLTLRLAVQRHRLIFRDYYVRRVLGYPWTFQLPWKNKKASGDSLADLSSTQRVVSSRRSN